MDLIVWRHAEAHEHPDPATGQQGDAKDLLRRLTPRGEKQAARMSAWLDRQLPQATRVLCSPAQRAEQTALALGRNFTVCDELAPGGDPQALLRLVQWPLAKLPVLVVGHQPALGRVVAQLMGMSEPDCAVRKGAVWWLQHRERAGVAQTVLMAVQIPALL